MRTITHTLIGLAVAASALVPVAAAAQKVSYDVRRDANLAGVKTFGFRSEPASRVTEKTTTYDSPFVDERTRMFVAQQLERRGWKRDDTDPDVFVVTRRTFKTEYTSYGPYGWPSYAWYPYATGPYAWGPYYGGYAYGAGWWDGWGPQYVVETVRGTLIVDIEEAESGQLLWRGVGTRLVHEHTSAEGRAKHVSKEVDHIFKKFPSGGR